MLSTRTRRGWVLLAGLLGFALLEAPPAAGQTQIVVVDDTLFDFFSSGQNPGCGGCGLRDWDDLFATAWGTRRLSNGTMGGTSCSGLSNPPDPDWDDATALNCTLEIRSTVTQRLDGMVTEFDDQDDPFPPHDPAVDGAILSLTGTYALRHTGSTGGISNTIKGHLLIQQGSDFYVSQHNVGAPSGGGLGLWVRVGESGGVPIVFMADNFGKVLSDDSFDMGQTPDFSENGAPLFFGFALDMSYVGPLGGPPGNNFLNRSLNIDDIEFTLTVADEPALVPGLAPTGLGLLGAALVAARVAVGRRDRTYRS